MSVTLCTLVLNEMQWLPKLYEQHKDWPGLVQWVFVESADLIYARTNPNLVSYKGLSTDGTTEFLEMLAKADDRVVHIKHGYSNAEDPAQGKCASRTRYLEIADQAKPTYLVILDADEFYMRDFQSQMIEYMDLYRGSTAFVFKHREIWHPESVKDEPLFSFEVKGGFWDIPYCRCWRWHEGLCYRSNHNTPETPDGHLLDVRMKRLDLRPRHPFFIHMGFAAEQRYRVAKNNYYIARGEGRTDRRGWYTESRAAWEMWLPGDALPRGAKVVPYDGPIPECFLGDS